MRDLIATEKPPRDEWDVKLVPGGLIDLRIHRPGRHADRRARGRGAVDLDGGGAGAPVTEFSATHRRRDELVEAHNLFFGLIQLLRVCLTGPFEPDDVPEGLSDLLLARRRICPKWPSCAPM